MIPGASSTRPRVCLNMIVKDEEAVLARCIESVRACIDHWVIVDTGSTDRTRELAMELLKDIPGELHRRPWRDFGHNRTEAIQLARGKADFIFVMDADNIFHAPDGWQWPALDGTSYDILHRSAGFQYRQCVLASDRLAWRYEGVVHEYITTDEPHETRLLEGPWIERRHEGARSRDPDTFRKDAAALEGALASDPSNRRTVFYLAQSWRDAKENAKALEAYERRIGMGGWAEEIWYSMYQAAQMRSLLDRPGSEVIEAYLRAFQYRPQRAEPLVRLAQWHRGRSEWNLARLFARAAQGFAKPPDALFLEEAAYDWLPDDEAAIAAFWTGDMLESFRLCCALLDGDRLPEDQRARVEANRDYNADAVARATAVRPEEIVRRLSARGSGEGDVTLTITACKRLELFEKTVDSFLSCCTDIDRVSRFICIDDNSTQEDRRRMQEAYPFFEFVFKRPEEKGHAKSMNRLRDEVRTPYWLHLEDDWHFIVSTDYVARSIAVLEREPGVAQVLFNRNYAETLEDRAIAGGIPRRSGSGIRYVLHEHYPEGPSRDRHLRGLPAGARSNAWWPHYSLRPSLARTSAIQSLGRFREDVPAFELEFAQRYADAGFQSAFLDSITSLHIGRLVSQRGSDVKNAYELNEERQF